MTNNAPTTKLIEVFRPGTFKPMVGDAITFSSEDLKSLAEAYDVTGAPAPAVVGHPKTDHPAYAWAKSFRYDADGDRLLAELGDIEPAFADAVAAGRYKKISLELFSPAAPNNPTPGSWYPKHIGFLGAVAPAVPGLKPVAFAGGGEGCLTFEFADAAALRDVAGLFRSLREFIIEKFGSDTADKALPSWTIGWIDDAAVRELAEDNPGGPAFSDLTPKSTKEPIMSPKPDDAALQQRANDLAERERRIAERERAQRHTANVSFAEALIGEGRLLPAVKDKAVALLDALSGETPPEVSFAEGDKTIREGAAETLKALLQAQPKAVSFGAADLGQDPGAGIASFALPDGATADAASMALHQKAVAYQAAHPDATYMAAVAAVQS